MKWPQAITSVFFLNTLRREKQIPVLLLESNLNVANKNKIILP